MGMCGRGKAGGVRERECERERGPELWKVESDEGEWVKNTRRKSGNAE